jgi:FlaA1/EpsC-like NDP-sugar epimerase
MYTNKNIVITGTGSWATEIIKQLLLYNPKKIIAFSRNELAVVTKKKLFKNHENVSIEIGDITNLNDCQKYFKNADIVFCTSALKHVSIAENNPNEAIRVNIQGSQNIIKACEENDVSKAILVSTDKACEPVNTYGLTKAIVEKLWLNQSKVSKNAYTIFRAGNVLNSNGSVIPIFKEQIANNSKITLTDLSVTRYFITLEEVVSQLLNISSSQPCGTIAVPNMNSYLIIHLAFLLYLDNYMTKIRFESILKEAMEIHYKLFKENDIQITGLQQGEKMHESLISSYEKDYTNFDKNHYRITSYKVRKPLDFIPTSESVSCLEALYQYLYKSGIITFKLID